MKAILNGMAWIHADDMEINGLFEYRKQLTVTPRKMHRLADDPKPIFMYEQRGNYIGIPREYFFQKGLIGIDIEYRLSHGNQVFLKSRINFRHDQENAHDVAVDYLKHPGTGLIIQAEPGFGKCLKIGTKVLHYNGDITCVEDVKAGDMLMGPDSKPKKVLSTTRGVGELRRIIPIKGESWVCNDVHILTLVNNKSKEIVDISIDEWRSLTESQRSRYKQFSPPNGIDFPEPYPKLPIDPYFAGIWIGDGTKNLNGVAISNPDVEIYNECDRIARKFDLFVRTDYSYNGCPTYHITCGERGGSNRLLSLMRDIFGRNSCSIPKKFLVSSRYNRREFFAGILDTDGNNAGGCMEIIQSRKGYADGICFLARSLGFMVTVSEKVVNSKTCYRMIVSGDFKDIPMRIKRKFPGERKQIKCATRTGISIRDDGVGEYAGFELDSDGRFLLGDFTVTHNTVVACSIIATIGMSTLVLVDREFLMNQWKARLEEFVPGVKVGFIRSNICQTSGCDVVIGMMQSMRKGKYPQEVYDWPGLVIADEVHRISAPTFSPLMPMFRARNRIGLSVGPESVVELRGGIFGRGWVGKIQDAYSMASRFFSEKDGVIDTRNSGISSRGWSGRDFKWKEVKKIFRHNCTDNVKELTVSGNRLVATASHEIFRVAGLDYKYVNGKKKEIAGIEKCRVADIVEGDCLFVDNGNEWGGGSLGSIDVPSIIMKSAINLSKVHVAVGLTREDVKEYDSKTRWRYLNGKYGSRLPIKEFIRKRKFLSDPELIYTEGASGTYVSCVVELRDWAYMFGFWLGNGWLDGGKICFSVKERDVSNFIEKMSDLRWVNWKLSTEKRQGSCQVGYSNRIVAEIFRSVWGDKIYCYKKWIPGEWIVGWKKNDRMELLMGLLDSDGSLSERDGDKKSYHFTTTSKSLAYGCQSLLRSLGVLSGCSVSERVSGGMIDGRRIKGRRIKYVVYFSKHALDGNSYGRYGSRRRFVHGDMNFAEGIVREIRDVARPKYVYDLEVCGHCSFVSSGILVHNSATPRRKDGTEKVFLYHIGRVGYKSNTKKMDIIVKRVWTGFDIIKTDKVDPGKLPKEIKLKFLYANKKRNQRIALELERIVEAKRKVIVLSSSLFHLDRIKDYFLDTKLGPCTVVDYYTGQWFTNEVDENKKRKKKKRTDDELKKAERAQVIFATFQMASQALDIPDIDTEVLASPMSDVEQAVGRAARYDKGKKTPVIIVDMVDSMIPEFNNMYLSREKFYKRKGYLKGQRDEKNNRQKC